MGEQNIALLKSEIEKTLGRKIITSTECRYLYISLSTHQSKVSFNTLRRFFGLLKSNFQPSTYTLDVLSNYCGYTSFTDFCQSHQKFSLFNDHIDDDFINYLAANFKNTVLNESESLIFTQFVLHSIIFLERHPHLIDAFQRKIAQTKNGQQYYFEQCIYIDKLNSFYGDGIRYYMNAKDDPGSIFFGCYISGFKSWLLMDNGSIEKYYTILSESEFGNTDSIILQGYKLPLQIFYLHAYGFELDYVLLKARQLLTEHFVSIHNFTHIYRFEIQLVTALILCRQFGEALIYIDDLNKIINEYDLPVSDLRQSESLLLYKSIALHQTGHIAEAKKIFDTIDPNKYHFLHKQFLTILYLSLQQQFQKNKSAFIHLKSLLNETGFKRLNHYLNANVTPMTVPSF